MSAAVPTALPSMVLWAWDWDMMGPRDAELGLSDTGDWDGVMLGWGLGRGDAEPGEEGNWEGVMLGWEGVMLGWGGVKLGWYRTGTKIGTGMGECQAGDWDGAMAGWKRTGQGKGMGCYSPHPTAGGLRGARVPGQAGCLRGAPYPEDGPGVEVPLVPVEEQKVVREEEDVDAQPGCLQGKAAAS